MNRLIPYLFGFLVLAQANALALNCDLSKFKLGKNISNFEKEKEMFIFGEVMKNINAISIPIEFPCKKTEADGTFIKLFFINDKVIRIVFENTIKENKPLFRIANDVYKAGFKENQKIIDANQPEQYALEKNGVYFLYANIKGINENKGNFFELFEIVDKKYEDAASKEAIAIEEK